MTGLSVPGQDQQQVRETQRGNGFFTPIKYENSHTLDVLIFVQMHPGSSIRDVQAGLHLSRGNPAHTQLRWEIFDILEILTFTGYLSKRGWRFYPTAKTAGMVTA